MGIEIKNVSKSFKKTTALDQVSLTFEKEHIYGLLGNNGAGKTTLMNLISNRLYVSSGQILIDGEAVEDNDRALGKVFMMGDANLYPEDMKLKKILKYTPIFYPDFDIAYANRLMDKFHLNPNKKIPALSTGQQSLFRLVLALSCNADYLLLDEPVLGLDASNRDIFYRLLLEKFSEKPFCAVISTHLIQEIENLTEYTIIIRNGKVLTNQDNETLKSNCYCVSGPAAAVDAFIEGKTIIHTNCLGGLKSVSIQGQLPSEAVPAGLEISSISLQDYFIQKMNEEENANE